MNMSMASAVRIIERESTKKMTNRELVGAVKQRFGFEMSPRQVIEILGPEKDRLGDNAFTLDMESLSNGPLVTDPPYSVPIGEDSASLGGFENDIYVPPSLLEAVERAFPKRTTIENHLLIWAFIDAWPYSDRTKADWRTISDKALREVVSDGNIRVRVRDWLESNGFIKIKKYNHRDGEKTNFFIPGSVSYSYRAISHEPLVPYRLEKKDYWGGLSSYTADDLACRITRENLGLLAKIPERRPLYDCKKDRLRKKNRDVFSLFKLQCNVGNVTRGRRVSRLYSPWVGAGKQVRKCFLLDGCGIRCLDLKAAQPTMIAQMAGDTQMLEDCQSDALYLGIAEMLGVQRDGAKKPFMAYAYGDNRKNGQGNMAAFRVQEWMKERYPKAADFMAHHKTVNHFSELSCLLQSTEASIFVDGILTELNDLGIPALTVHDALYYRDYDHATVEETANRNLELFLPSKQYSLDGEVISTTE